MRVSMVAPPGAGAENSISGHEIRSSGCARLESRTARTHIALQPSECFNWETYRSLYVRCGEEGHFQVRERDRRRKWKPHSLSGRGDRDCFGEARRKRYRTPRDSRGKTADPRPETAR